MDKDSDLSEDNYYAGLRQGLKSGEIVSTSPADLKPSAKNSLKTQLVNHKSEVDRDPRNNPDRVYINPGNYAGSMPESAKARIKEILNRK